MTYNTSYVFQGGNASGSRIGVEHFGTNYLFHHDRVSEGSSFPEVKDRVGIDLIRYPGGTVTEEYFDLSDPTANVQASSFGHGSRPVTPIDAFLDYVGNAGAQAVIVLPTYRYFDHATRRINPAAEAEIKGFIRAVMAGDFGQAQINGFEIGNEWYQKRFDWTATEFGKLQSKIAGWIDEVLQEDRAWSEADIYVQAARGDDDKNGIADNLEIAAEFSPAEMAAVDGLVTHYYASTSSSNPLVLGGALGRRFDEIKHHWGISGNTGPDLAVTEWNIGENGPDNTSINGLMRNVALLNVFSQMMENGVDLSTIWTAQAPSPAALSNKEGSDALTATGYLYRMMRRELVDTRAVNMTQDEKIHAADGTAIARSYVFESANKTVLYIASGVDRSINLDVNLATYMSPGAHIHATILGAAPGAQATDYHVTPEMTAISATHLGTGGRHQINLGQYEVIQFVITRNSGVDLFGDDANATHDWLAGTAHADKIYGFDGNDTITGFGGKDVLAGGDGDDIIDGGQSDDLIIAGNGSDKMFGGSGDDTLDYSQSTSAVRIYAREGIVEKDGTDEVDTFTKVENFIGSDYDDTIFVAKTTRSVQSGDGDDFARVQSGGDLSLEMGDGDDFVLLETGEATVDLGDGDDRLLSYCATVRAHGGNGNDDIQGGDHADEIGGGAGNDTLTGGDGADVFVFAPAEGMDVITDFDLDQDRLDLTAFGIGFADLGLAERTDSTVLHIDGTNVAELLTIAQDDITADMFIF